MNKIRLGNKDIYYQVFYKNNKNMYLRVKEDRLVITCNKLVSRLDIEKFILDNEVKILRTLATYQTKVSLYNENEFMFFGKKLQLMYKINQRKNSYRIFDDYIEVNFTKGYFDNKYIENIYQKELLSLMKEIQAKEETELTKYFDLSDITYKTQLMKSRFGSCISKRKIIKLNSILARFNVDYTRTILLHEIIHLKVFNHQKEFYQYIDLFIPNYRQIIKQLNQLTRKYVI